MTYKFNECDYSRGAPMGRFEYGDSKIQGKATVRLFQVHLDNGGYDNGGAYWGIGPQLWCALADEYRRFTRAATRREAMLELGLTRYQLKNKRGIYG